MLEFLGKLNQASLAHVWLKFDGMRTCFWFKLGFLRFADIPNFIVFSRVFWVSENNSGRSKKAFFDNMLVFCLFWGVVFIFFCFVVLFLCVFEFFLLICSESKRAIFL